MFYPCPSAPVMLLYILLGTVAALACALATVALLFAYWIEMLLLCRTCQDQDETLGGKGLPMCVTVPLRTGSGAGAPEMGVP